MRFRDDPGDVNLPRGQSAQDSDVWLDRCENRLNEPANAATALKFGSSKGNSAQRSEIQPDRAADRQFRAKNGSIEPKSALKDRKSPERAENRRVESVGEEDAAPCGRGCAAGRSWPRRRETPARFIASVGRPTGLEAEEHR